MSAAWDRMSNSSETANTDTTDTVVVTEDGRIEVHHALFGPLVLPPTYTPAQIERIRTLRRRRLELAPLAYGAGTWKAYKAAWGVYSRWCDDLGYEPLSGDPETLSQYLVWMERRDEAGRPVYKRSTIDSHWAAICAAHEQAGVSLDTKDPRIAVILKAIRRSKRHEAVDEADPITIDLLREMLRAAPDSVLGLRNKAAILVGFLGCMRRSEVEGLRVSDAALHYAFQDGVHGLLLKIRSSKTDQTGEGNTIGIPDTDEADLNASAALEAWLEARTVMSGGREPDGEDFLFCALTKSGKPKDTPLTGHVLNTIVQDLVEKVRLAHLADDAALKRLGLYRKFAFSAHSLRAGMATEVARAGGETAELMRTGRWKSAQTASGYVRDVTAHRGASRVLGQRRK